MRRGRGSARRTSVGTSVADVTPTADDPLILIAPDKFRGSLTSEQAARAIERGVRSVLPAARVESFLLADGGEGTLATAAAGDYDLSPVRVAGPTGEPVDTSIAVHGRTALIELADACGMQRLPGSVPAPMTATTYGVGQALRAALDLEVDRVVLAVGGSASTDGGIGMLAALGIHAVDVDRRRLAPVPESLGRAASLDRAEQHPRLAGISLEVATDVTNPLLGEHGAARVFGPQKGADPGQIDLLESWLTHWAGVLDGAAAEAGQTDDPIADAAGGGAAGGIAAAAIAVLGGRVVSGASTVLRINGLADRVPEADLVITGEGSLDAQTLAGKAPAALAALARQHGVSTVAVAGRLEVSPDQLADNGIEDAIGLGELESDPQLCMENADELVESAVGDLVRRWRSRLS